LHSHFAHIHCCSHYSVRSLPIGSTPSDRQVSQGQAPSCYAVSQGLKGLFAHLVFDLRIIHVHTPVQRQTHQLFPSVYPSQASSIVYQYRRRPHVRLAGTRTRKIYSVAPHSTVCHSGNGRAMCVRTSPSCHTCEAQATKPSTFGHSGAVNGQNSLRQPLAQPLSGSVNVKQAVGNRHSAQRTL
jgi:hypothetical protein